MSKKHRYLFIIMIMMMACTISGKQTTIVYAADLDDGKIVIVHSNDVHCMIDQVTSTNEEGVTSVVNAGYAGFAGVVNKEKETNKNVFAVDAGDSIQGKPVGILTKGQAVIDIMNEVGYDVSAVGNHEFDYGVARFLELSKKANFPFVSCNFMDVEKNQPVLDAYEMKTYEVNSETKKIAFLGISTPETIARTAADVFQDEDGKFKYSFCQDETGEALYARIQQAVDKAREEGADYVIALGHLGDDGVTSYWRSESIVKNSTGIDAVIDGHSHESYNKIVKNKDNQDVVVAQTGTEFFSVGVMTIDLATGSVEDHTEVAPIPGDEKVKAKVDSIKQELSGLLNTKVAESKVDLYAFEDDDYNWAVRVKETNVADLVADAMRYELGADVAIINGGGIRANIKKGDVTYNDLLSVLPFGNDTAVVKATGQQILDALEKGAMIYPDYSGDFMQVSGITYDIMENVPSSIKVDTNNIFLGVEGEYRVQNVKINGVPLDLQKKYTVAGIAYTLLQQGSGMSMFANCEAVNAAGPKDFEVLASYVKNTLQGVIDAPYENRDGNGRINIKIKPSVTPTVKPSDAPTASPKPSLKAQKIITAKIKAVKAKTLKKKAATIKLKAKTDGNGNLTYKVTGYPKKMKKFIKVSNKGVVTLKKKAKKGTYEVTITAAAKGNYKKTTKIIKIKVK